MFFQRMIGRLGLGCVVLCLGSRWAQAQPIALVNPSFEQPVVATNQYYWYLNNPNAPGWVSRNPSDGGIYHPTNYLGGVPDGVNVARVNNWGLRFNQTVATVVEAGKTYRARISVGNPEKDYRRAGRFELWAGAQFGSTPDDIVGGHLLAGQTARTAAWGPGQDEALIPDLGFVELTLRYTPQAGDPAIGKPLTLSFYTIGGSAGPTDWDAASLEIEGGSSNSSDLGVRFISRAPLYWRYNVQYPNNLPTLAPTHNGQDPLLDKHWPAPAEVVTFTAHIRNHGSASVSSFQYRWYIDNAPMTAQPQTYNGTVEPGGVATVTLTWPWPATLDDHTVKIVVDPAELLPDPYRQNNTYTDYTNALSFSIWVEQKLFEKFNQKRNGFGTFSFDDWFRWQFDAMKDRLANSVYPDVAPFGIRERVRLEEINVVPFDPNNLNNWRDALNSDPHQMLNDGRWQFTSDATTLTKKEEDWSNYLAYALNALDWGLVHELAHQLGVIDEYRLNLESDQNLVRKRDGSLLGTRHIFHQGGLMGGGYILPEYDGTFFDSRTAGFLNRNLHYRRGYYGEYLFDTPQRTTIRVLDIFGSPLAGVRIKAYQKRTSDEMLPNTPVFVTSTNSAGYAILPNRPVNGVTTATGHTLRPNPFGQLHVVGVNSLMLLKFELGAQEDFRWFETIQLNEAVWRGEEFPVFPFATSLIPYRGVSWWPTAYPIGTQNLALYRPVKASSSLAQAPTVNDGDKATPDQSWHPNPTSAGQWWQVELAQSANLARAVVYPSAINWHDWYTAFHFEVSETGAFAGEQTAIPAETAWDASRDAGDYLLQRLTGLKNRVVYTFPPVRGRFFRIVSDVAQDWVQLQEVELYGITHYTPSKPKGDDQ